MTNINVAGELLFAFLRGKWIEDSGKSAYAKATADKCKRKVDRGKRIDKMSFLPRMSFLRKQESRNRKCSGRITIRQKNDMETR